MSVLTRNHSFNHIHLSPAHAEVIHRSTSLSKQSSRSKSLPTPVPEFDHMDSNKLLTSSYLYKRSSKTHQWRRVWVTLRKCQLSYYKDSSEHKPIKVIDRSCLLSFSEIPDHQKHHFAVYTNKKVLHFRSDDKNTLNAWKHALEVFLDENDKESTKDEPAEQQSVLSFTGEEIKEMKLDPEESKSDLFKKLSGTDVEYSGPEDPYLSSGLSDSPLPHDSVSTHYQIGEETIKEEDEEAIETPPAKTTKPPSSPSSISSSPTRKRRSSPVPEYKIEEGYLLRLRKRYNKWKRFYIVLTSENIYFYKNEVSTTKPYKTIPLSDIIDVIELDPLSRTKVWCLLIITPLKRLRFSASSEEEMIKWLSALKTLVKKNKGKTSPEPTK